jgi:uncharacterized protein (DUF433 family)
MTGNQAAALFARITTNPDIFGGKPIVRDKRLAVEHVLADLAAGETPETILANFPFLEAEDIRACLLFASREVGHSWVEHHHGRGTDAAIG